MKRRKQITLYGAGTVLAIASLAFVVNQERQRDIPFPDWSEPVAGTRWGAS